jgi:hypothetical protein
LHDGPQFQGVIKINLKHGPFMTVRKSGDTSLLS